MKVVLASVDNPNVSKLGGKHVHLLLLEKGLGLNGIEVTNVYYDPNEVAEKLKMFYITYGTILLPRF